VKEMRFVKVTFGDLHLNDPKQSAFHYPMTRHNPVDQLLEEISKENDDEKSRVLDLKVERK
jgi:hypothetical protein